MKKSFSSIAAVFSIGAMFSASAGGIPTFDATQLMQMQQQFRQLQEQYKALKEQYAAITGSYGRGQMGLSDSLGAAAVVPGSWQEVVNKQRNGEFASKQASYEKLIDTLPPDLFTTSNAQSAATYKLSTDSVRAALSGGDVLYSQVQTHLSNLSRLSQVIDGTQNIKDAQDLQNRISAENGMMQSAIAKLNAVNINLQANMLNQQNQATAATQKYFRRTTP
ncbi:type IV secretion system protein [Acidovorax sp. CCYZU-2555]|uniref:type IV secretion system protein n=1 Tax=Acidovorax sp. CCYZU-2555 TaxID=2835042 RepID=UPI0032DFBF65